MKYNSERDKILDWMVTSDWANESNGSVESSTGHFARVCNDESDRAGLLDAFGADMEDCEPPVAFEQLLGNFIVREDDQGFVTVTEYKTLAECEAAYNALLTEYDHLVNDTDDDESEPWVTDHPDFPQGTFVTCMDFRGSALVVRRVQGDWAECVMYGDDSKHLIELSCLVAIDRERFCGECGQIGCQHDGLEREDDSGPCCYGFVTSRGQVHEVDCPSKERENV